MIYIKTPPKEHKRILTPYSIPGLKKIRHIPTGMKGPKIKDAFVSVSVKNGYISFYTKAQQLLQITGVERLGFTLLDDEIFIHKQKNGNIATRLVDGGLRMIHRSFTGYLKNNFGIKKTMRFQIIKTNNEFEASPMFKILLPERNKRIYKQINNA